MVNDSYSHIATFINSIPSVFDTEGTLIYEERNVVKRFDAPDGTPLIVKRFKFPNPVQRFAYSFYRPSKARRAYEYALRLIELGIDTPTPIAYIEEKRNGLFTYGYFMSAENNNPDCRLLRNDPHFDNDRLARDLMAFIASLHEKGVLHGDTNLSNFLYEKRGDNYHFAVIDINRSKFVSPPPTQEQCLRNLVRITHIVSLLKYLVGIYAEIRGWDAEESTSKVMAMLHHFEQRRKAKHAFRIWRLWRRKK